MFSDILQPTHLLFVLVIALIVLGPKRLPEVGRSLGRGLRDFKSALGGDDDDRRDELAQQAPAYTADEPAPTAEPAPITTSAPSTASEPSTASVPEPPQPATSRPTPAAGAFPAPPDQPAAPPTADEPVREPAEHTS